MRSGQSLVQALSVGTTRPRCLDSPDHPPPQPDYMPPEVLTCPTKDTPEDNKDRLDLSYGLGADIWSTGILAYELVNGVPPFTRHEREITEKLIMSGGLPSFLMPASHEMKDFVNNCLVESCLRPSAASCLKHPWVTGKSSSKERDRRQTDNDGLGDMYMESFEHQDGSRLKREASLEQQLQPPQTRSPSPIHLSPDPKANQWKSPILAAASKQKDDSETDEDDQASSSIRRFMAEGFRSGAASPTLICHRYSIVKKDISYDDDDLEVPEV